jgi:outer membrane translocation and assembly module TamA
LTKYVPENEHLLQRVKIKSDIKNIGHESLKPYLRQRPNSGIFGAYKLQLRVYNLSGRDSTRRFNRFLRRIGEPPVLYSEDMTEETSKQMQQFLANKGYYDADVQYNVVFRKKKAVVNYSITGNKAYHIRNFHYEIDDDSIRPFLLQDSVNTTIKKGDLFDIDVLELERQRLVKMLHNKGFYYFNKDHLYIVADSSLNSYEVDLMLKSYPMVVNNADGTTDSVQHKRIKIRRVTFTPWYDPERRVREQAGDTVHYKGYTFLYDKKRYLRPSLLTEKTFIEPGKYYNEHSVEKTYSALNGLSTTKYTTINFRDAGNDEINCMTLMAPVKLQNFSIEVEGNNTDGDIGAAVSGTYQHRNLFRGAELFRFKTKAAYQPMGKISNLLSNNSIDLGGEASVQVPKFLFPFLSSKARKQLRATTEFSLSYNWQTNPWYTRTIAGTNMKYQWFTGSQNTERYTITPIDINYVYLPRISDLFRDLYLNNSSIIRYSYEDHFIMSSGFSFQRNTQPLAKPLENYFVYRGSAETGGNLLWALYSLSNAKKEDGAYTIGNIRFAQYAKGEFDYAYYNVIDSRNKLVFHGHAGIAFPYGNADVVPFEKRFTAGGANSVRGWSVWSLGPGIYRSNSSTDFMQIGDIKLDLNIEYRFKLFWVLEGAAFVDAGNVWTIKNYEDQKGGVFAWDSFYKQLAYSYGFGLRFDFSFFLFRIDMGSKLYNPADADTGGWCFPIRSNNFAYHFAIGYPF